jgi:hypothetical protein
MQFGDAALLEVRWVPSAANPADAISRMYEEEDEGGADPAAVTRGGEPMSHIKSRLASEPQAGRAFWQVGEETEDAVGEESGSEESGDEAGRGRGRGRTAHAAAAGRGVGRQ